MAPQSLVGSRGRQARLAIAKTTLLLAAACSAGRGGDEQPARAASPGSSSTTASTTASTASAVPAEPSAPVADTAVDCGVDLSLRAAEVANANVGPAPLRRCLADANEAGEQAVLTAWEPGDAPGAALLFVYRTGADRSVEVSELVSAWGPWVRSTCTTLERDGVRGFLLQGCSVPVVVAPEAADQ